jgi:hypothetical protein
MCGEFSRSLIIGISRLSFSECGTPTLVSDGSSHSASSSCKNLRGSRLLYLRVLRLGFLQDGDVGVGVFPDGDKSTHGYLLRRPPEVDHPQNDERKNSA